MLTHLQALLVSGCLVMHSLATLLDLLWEKSKITSSGFLGYAVKLCINLCVCTVGICVYMYLCVFCV